MTDDSTSGLSGAVNQSSAAMSKGKLSEAPQTDFYTDLVGREWRCVNNGRQMICTEGKSFTVASFETFRRWDWRPGRAALPTPETIQRDT